MKYLMYYFSFEYKAACEKFNHNLSYKMYKFQLVQGSEIYRKIIQNEGRVDKLAPI